MRETHSSLSASGLQGDAVRADGSVGRDSGGRNRRRLGQARTAVGRYLVIGMGLLLCSPFAVWTFAAAELTVATKAGGVFGIFSGVMMANTMAAAYDVVPARSYGLAAGVLTMIGGSAGGLAILFAGVVKERLRDQIHRLRVAAMGSAASAVLILVIAWRYPRGHPQ